MTSGPSAGGNPETVDIRRRVQDGTAPAPDRVTEAFRAEVLRQGLTEYEEDGFLYRYRNGVWHVEPGGYRACMERLAPPVDADPDPDPAPTRNPISDLYAALRARARRGGTKP